MPGIYVENTYREHLTDFDCTVKSAYGISTVYVCGMPPLDTATEEQSACRRFPLNTVFCTSLTPLLHVPHQHYRRCEAIVETPQASNKRHGPRAVHRNRFPAASRTDTASPHTQEKNTPLRHWNLRTLLLSVCETVLR